MEIKKASITAYSRNRCRSSNRTPSFSRSQNSQPLTCLAQRVPLPLPLPGSVPLHRLNKFEKHRNYRQLTPPVTKKKKHMYASFLCLTYADVAVGSGTDRMRSSKAVKATFAPSPIAITICLYGTVVTSPAA